MPLARENYLGVLHLGSVKAWEDWFTLLIEIMASVPASDTTLVNLYANLGDTDPLVVATALDGQRADEAALFGPVWIVVSGDKAVLQTAQEFELPVQNNAELQAIIEFHGVDDDEQ